MEALQLLLGSDIGLLSVFTIGFILAMSVWFGRYFAKKMEEDARNSQK